MSDIDPTIADPAPEPDPAPEVEPDTGGQEPEEDAPLGPAGQKALAAEKERRKAEAAKRRELETRLAEMEAKYGDATERERREFEKSVKAEALSEVRAARVEVIAATKLADPTDAARFLDLNQFEMDEKGRPDKDEVLAALDTLLQERPYLAARPPGRFQGGVDQGPRKTATPSLDEQIAEAEKAGDHRLAIRLKRQRYAASQ